MGCFNSITCRYMFRVKNTVSEDFKSSKKNFPINWDPLSLKCAILPRNSL